MKVVNVLLYIISKKYISTALLFLLWLLVFDKNNLISQVELTKKLHLLKEDKKYYREEIKKDSISTVELLTKPEELEKFAREKYLMKRDSEDIFLVINPDTVVKK
jgi:cell division protein DivIC